MSYGFTMIHDFDLFDAKGYLKENFLDDPPDSEDLGLISFFDRHTDERELQLEVFGGPTIYQLLPSIGRVKKIVFAEFNASNRKEVMDFIASAKDAFGWEAHIRAFLKERDHSSYEPDITEVKRSISSLVADVIPMDIRKDDPLLGYPHKRFDLVSCHYGIESVTDDKAAFLGYFSRLVRLLRPGGRMNLSMLEGATHYFAGTQVFPAYPIKKEEMHELLKSFRFKDIVSERVIPSNRRPYGSVFYMTAIKG
ncbi:MAG: NNMT/PNMT/TEMT family class I SAM-dependent methyltransferase [Candidatus Woesearchaeota archaeon]|nr:NNMT/PNMT/TEMT family class I SAM-dependent methyltransferase [Candidatus Woesearchaeota archaeon]